MPTPDSQERKTALLLLINYPVLLLVFWSRGWESNPRPDDYESSALASELPRLGGNVKQPI